MIDTLAPPTLLGGRKVERSVPGARLSCKDFSVNGQAGQAQKSTSQPGKAVGHLVTGLNSNGATMSSGKKFNDLGQGVVIKRHDNSAVVKLANFGDHVPKVKKVSNIMTKELLLISSKTASLAVAAPRENSSI